MIKPEKKRPIKEWVAEYADCLKWTDRTIYVLIDSDATQAHYYTDQLLQQEKLAVTPILRNDSQGWIDMVSLTLSMCQSWARIDEPCQGYNSHLIFLFCKDYQKTREADQIMVWAMVHSIKCLDVDAFLEGREMILNALPLNVDFDDIDNSSHPGSSGDHDDT